MTPSGTVWAMVMVQISMVKVIAYFLVCYLLLYVIGWALVHFIRPIKHFIDHD